MLSEKYKHALVYQIYPRSFCDSDGDGVGDIPGIISKLDYLASLGVGVIWLSPVYKSPNDDNGYDIADYCAIQPEFGTMADFDRLLAEARARGISIIMDLVINHTSDEHEWFRRALAGEQKYRDYYVIKKGKDGGLPNNWGNFFADCPWEPFGDPANNEYYLHLFSKKQPDLNWDNPALFDEIASIMRFWLDKGVAGFRCDVINVIHKRSYEDGKPHLALTGKEHYLSTEGTHAILNRLNREVLSHYDAFTVGETVLVDIPMAHDLVDPERAELDMVFAFEHMECDQIGVKWFKTRFRPRRLMRVLTKWQQGLDWNTLYFENHDQPRSVTRFTKGGEWRRAGAKMLLGLLFTLRGTTYIYQGQEIGMTNGAFDNLSEIVDIESHNVDKMAMRLGILNPWRWHLIRKTSRDNARTPMQWSAESGAGFTTGIPWLKIHPNYQEVNVERDLLDADGVIAYLRRLVELKRTQPALRDGAFADPYESRSVYGFSRVLGDECLTVRANFSSRAVKAPMPAGEVIFSSYPTKEERLMPYEIRVIHHKKGEA